MLTHTNTHFFRNEKKKKKKATMTVRFVKNRERVEKNTLGRDWNSAGLKPRGAARRNFVPILARNCPIFFSAHAQPTGSGTTS